MHTKLGETSSADRGPFKAGISDLPLGGSELYHLDMQAVKLK